MKGITGAALAVSAAVTAMSSVRVMAPEDIPDRVCVDNRSPHFNSSYKRLGVRFNGIERKGDVEEFCVSEGWIRVRIKGDTGKWRIGEDGQFLTERLEGKVEPYWNTETFTVRGREQDAAMSRQIAEQRMTAAEEKRARKAAKLAREFGGRS